MNIIVFIIIALTSMQLYAKDYFFKVGYDISDCCVNINERFKIAFEYDFKILNAHIIGIEIQSFYSPGQEGYYAFFLNLFAHLKWKSKKYILRPYLGLGSGLISLIDNRGVGIAAALQNLAGLEINASRKINII